VNRAKGSLIAAAGNSKMWGYCAQYLCHRDTVENGECNVKMNRFVQIIMTARCFLAALIIEGVLDLLEVLE